PSCHLLPPPPPPSDTACPYTTLFRSHAKSRTANGTLLCLESKRPLDEIRIAITGHQTSDLVVEEIIWPRQSRSKTPSRPRPVTDLPLMRAVGGRPRAGIPAGPSWFGATTVRIPGA